MGAAKALDLTDESDVSQRRAKQGVAARATVYIARVTVRSVLMREMKNYGIQDLKFVETPEECIADLQANPASMLVVDWECGEQKVVKALRAAQGTYRVDTRPIYFIALEVSQRVIAVATEFNVAQIHTGEISQEHIVKNLDELMVFTGKTQACQEAFREVTVQRKNGEWEASAETLKNLCDGEPDNVRAAVEYGYSLYESGQVEEADKWLHATSQRFPKDLRTKHLLARCAMKKGRFEDAQKLLDEASLISPHNIERLVDLGRVLLNLDQVAKALGTFNEALQSDKDFHEAKIGKAQCDLLSGHVNDAMKLLTQLESPQEVASVFNSAAILAIRHQQYKQGLSLYKTACGYLREDTSVLARVLFNMGIGLIKWGKTEAAQLAFAKATTLDPELSKARHNLGVLSALGGKSPLSAQAPAELTKDDPLEALNKSVRRDMNKNKSAPHLAKAKGAETPSPSPETTPVASTEVTEEVDDTYFQSLVTST